MRLGRRNFWVRILNAFSVSAELWKTFYNFICMVINIRESTQKGNKCIHVRSLFILIRKRPYENVNELNLSEIMNVFTTSWASLLRSMWTFLEISVCSFDRLQICSTGNRHILMDPDIYMLFCKSINNNTVNQNIYYITRRLCRWKRTDLRIPLLKYAISKGKSLNSPWRQQYLKSSLALVFY